MKGVKEDGKDIESVIGRVESSLARGELDIAVEEAANLKGWSRMIGLLKAERDLKLSSTWFN